MQTAPVDSIDATDCNYALHYDVEKRATNQDNRFYENVDCFARFF